MSVWVSLSFPVFVDKFFTSNFSDVEKYFEFELLNINFCAKKLFYLMLTIVKQITISFADLNIFHWLIVSAVIWTIIHGIYLKCVKLLLERVGVEKQDRRQLIETIWQVCFTAVSLPLVVRCLNIIMVDTLSPSGGWLDRLNYQLIRCKVHEDMPVPGIRSVFVLLSSFSVHDFINTWYLKGFRNLECMQKQLLWTIFILTYYSKCPLFGLSLVFLVQRATVVELLSKLLCLLSRFTHSKILNCVSKALCGCYFIFWCGTFLYILPMFLTCSKTIDSGMMKAELKMLIILDFMMWIYVIISLFTSLFSRALLSAVVPSSARPPTIEYFLFGCDPWMMNLTQCQSKSSLSSQLLLEDTEDSEEARKQKLKDNTRILMQTIRCSIMLKRKLKRIRENKAKELENEESNEL